nr:MAG TPA: hypothetical protein [Caudoviricetes sp.]
MVNFFKISCTVQNTICSKIAVLSLLVTPKTALYLFRSLAPL